MNNKKQTTIKLINLRLEERYLNKKFLVEDDNDSLPEFQVTPADGIQKYKIKFTWKSKGVTLPTDAKDYDGFKDEKFKPIFNDITKIYVSQVDAQNFVDNIIKTKSSLFL